MKTNMWRKSTSMKSATLRQLFPVKTKKALAIPTVNFAETPASLKKIFK